MKLNSCHSEGDAVPADLTELYDGNIVRRSANCSFVLEEETNSTGIRPRQTISSEGWLKFADLLSDPPKICPLVILGVDMATL